MARHREPARPIKRNGFWYLARRVPADYRPFEKSDIVFITSRIAVADDPRGVRARRVVEELDDTLLRLWKAKKSGNDPDAEARYARAKETAQSMGFPYVVARQAAEHLPTEQILRRLEALATRNAPNWSRPFWAV